MCVLIDPGCIPKVFNTSNALHKEFQPILNWINGRFGRMVWGGTKYLTELKNTPKYRRYLIELDKSGLVEQLPCKEVDAVADALKQIESTEEFNDEHLAAIVVVSRCTVVCTSDLTAADFLKKSSLYVDHTHRGVRPPKIYSRRRNRTLLDGLRCPP